MLESLRKALGAKEAAKPVETLEVKLDTTEIQAAIDAAVAAVRVEFDEYKQTAEALVAEAEAALSARTAELATMTAKLLDVQAALDAAAADKVAAEAAALEAKLTARKEKVVAAIGTERASALLAVTEGMDDTAFSAVLAALGASASAEAAAPLFQEVGVEAQADAVKVNEESAEMKILKAQYGKK